MYGFAEMRNQTSAFLFQESPAEGSGKPKKRKTSHRADGEVSGCLGRSTEGAALCGMGTGNAISLCRSRAAALPS